MSLQARAPARMSRFHFGLGIYTEGIRDAIDVIEIGNHFHRVKNVAVAQLVFSQPRQVLRLDRGR